MPPHKHAPKPITDASVQSAGKVLQTRPFQPDVNTAQQAPQRQEEPEALTGGFDLTKIQYDSSAPPILPLGQPLQAKLTIGEPNDKYEQEADRVAHDVVQRIHETGGASNTHHSSEQPQTNSLMANPLHPSQRAAMRENKEWLQQKAKADMQRFAAGAGTAPIEVEQGINSARGGGQSLAPKLQARMGQAMGADFSGVRVHTDARADQLNRSVGAKAFTTGQDLFFKRGEYQPGSRGGQELIAHELTHVMQQKLHLQQQEFSPLSPNRAPLEQQKIRQQLNQPPPSELAPLIVEDSTESIKPGQTIKSEFLKQLKEAIYTVGREEYEGTNLGVDECPYIAYWFNKYSEATSLHVERALRKYTATEDIEISLEDMIQLACVRAKKGFELQVQTGRITELPDDVPKQVGEEMIPNKEMIIQRQEVKREAGQRRNLLSDEIHQKHELTRTRNTPSKFIQRGCIKQGDNAADNVAANVAPVQNDLPGMSLPELWGKAEKTTIMSRVMLRNAEFYKEGKLGSWKDDGGQTVVLSTTPLLSCAAVIFLDDLDNPTQINLYHATGSTIYPNEVKEYDLKGPIIVISAALETGAATYDELEGMYINAGVDKERVKIYKAVGGCCYGISTNGRIGMVALR